jgi:hypothetical protein
VIRDPPSLTVIKSLVIASPESVPLEDKDDTSALEYAILSDADVTIVKFLMHVTKTQLSRESSLSSSQPRGEMQENTTICKPNLPLSTKCTDRSVFPI